MEEFHKPPDRTAEQMMQLVVRLVSPPLPLQGTRRLRPARAQGPKVQQTRRWREMDSNLWYGGRRAEHFRASRASRVAPSTTAPRPRRECMRLPDARTHPGLSEWSDHLIWSWTKYRSVASDVMPSAVPGNEDALPVAPREVELEGSGPR